MIWILAGTSARQSRTAMGLAPEDVGARSTQRRVHVALSGLARSRSWRSRRRHGGGQKMKQRERADQRAVRLEELPDEALQAIEADREIEAVVDPNRSWRSTRHEIDDGERRHRGALVKLHRMAQHAVAEVVAPGQPGRRAVGEVVDLKAPRRRKPDGPGGSRSWVPPIARVFARSPDFSRTVPRSLHRPARCRGCAARCSTSRNNAPNRPFCAGQHSRIERAGATNGHG